MKDSSSGSSKDHAENFAPAPYNETSGYETFGWFFFPTSIVLWVSLAYGLSLGFGAHMSTMSQWLAEVLPILEKRLMFLEKADGYSHISFTATVVASFVFFPIMLLVNALGYWRTVVAKRQCNPVSVQTWTIMGRSLPLLVFFVWGAFVLTLGDYKPQRPGMSVFLCWPLFPAFGTIILWGCTQIVFMNLVGVLKFIFLRRGHNEQSNEQN